MMNSIHTWQRHLQSIWKSCHNRINNKNKYIYISPMQHPILFASLIRFFFLCVCVFSLFQKDVCLIPTKNTRFLCGLPFDHLTLYTRLNHDYYSNLDQNSINSTRRVDAFQIKLFICAQVWFTKEKSIFLLDTKSFMDHSFFYFFLYNKGLKFNSS
jgi:hypothetical protein